MSLLGRKSARRTEPKNDSSEIFQRRQNSASFFLGMVTLVFIRGNVEVTIINVNYTLEENSDRIFKMSDCWYRAWFSFDGNHVDLPVIDFVFRRVMIRRGEHVLAFAWSNGFFR